MCLLCESLPFVSQSKIGQTTTVVIELISFSLHKYHDHTPNTAEDIIMSLISYDQYKDIFVRNTTSSILL